MMACRVNLHDLRHRRLFLIGGDVRLRRERRIRVVPVMRVRVSPQRRHQGHNFRRRRVAVYFRQIFLHRG